jgi:uncharacterized protein DUF4349
MLQLSGVTANDPVVTPGGVCYETAPFAAAFAAALAIACGGNDFDSAGSNSAGSAGNASSAPDIGNSQSAQADASAAQARLIVNTNVALEVEDLRGAYRTAGDLARAAGGFIAESRIADGDEVTSAFLRLRVPGEQHDRVLESLRDVGRNVTGEETNAREVTGEYTDLQSRLVNLHRAEEQYQTLLSRAGSIDEILKVTARLDDVRGEIEQVQGRVNLLENQSDFATNGLTLSVPPPARTANLPSPVQVFVDAAEASLTVGHGVVNGVAVLAVVALWAVQVLGAYLLLRRPVGRLVEVSRRRLT